MYVSAVGLQGVVRSGTVFCRSRLRGLAGTVGSGVGIVASHEQWNKESMALSVSSTASGSEVSVGSQKPPFDLREPGAMPLKVPPRGSGVMPTISAPVTVPLGVAVVRLRPRGSQRCQRFPQLLDFALDPGPRILIHVPGRDDLASLS